MNRFWSKVDRTDTCWLWTASTDRSGYGQFRVAGKTVLAHRFAYEAEAGPIPDGLQLDHLCRVRHCVNPAHLEAVTPAVNNLRAPGCISNINRLKTECPAGHPLSGTNLYVFPDGRRTCRICKHPERRAA